MADIAPSANVTKLGSLLVIFVIALLAVWAANNIAMLNRVTAKKVA
jgi:hypothetical protein